MTKSNTKTNAKNANINTSDIYKTKAKKLFDELSVEYNSSDKIYMSVKDITYYFVLKAYLENDRSKTRHDINDLVLKSGVENASTVACISWHVDKIKKANLAHPKFALRKKKAAKK